MMLILTRGLAGFSGRDAWSISICKACLLSCDKINTLYYACKNHTKIFREKMSKGFTLFKNTETCMLDLIEVTALLALLWKVNKKMCMNLMNGH